MTRATTTSIPTRPATQPLGTSRIPRRRGSTLNEIERQELRILEGPGDPDDHDDERTNPWFPPPGLEPARRY
jgi:hypothetical protein